MSSTPQLSDVEEIPDWYLHRPLAVHVVRLLLPTRVTAHQVTIGGAAAGVLASAALVLGVTRPVLRLVSAGLLLASTVLDCADGQLARARRTMSAGGMALDATVDVVVVLSMVPAVTYAAVHLGASVRWWLLTPVVLASYAAHSFFFDVIKEEYLADHRIAYASSKAAHAREKMAIASVAAADRRSPRVIDLYWWAAGPIIEAARPAAMSRPHVRVWTLLGPGTHMLCLYLAAATSYVWAGALVTSLLVIAVAMNAVMAALFVARPKTAA